MADLKCANCDYFRVVIQVSLLNPLETELYPKNEWMRQEVKCGAGQWVKIDGMEKRFLCIKNAKRSAIVRKAAKNCLFYKPMDKNDVLIELAKIVENYLPEREV